MPSWSVESLWQELAQNKAELTRVRFSSGPSGQNFYFTLTKLPGECTSYQVQRYVPSAGEAVGQIKHTYRYLTHFNLLANRFHREGYDYALLY